MKTLARLLLAAAVAAGLFGWVVTAPAQLPEDWGGSLTPDAEAGARIFWAGGCASCHVAPEAKPGDAPILSGGKKFETAFGTFYAPNISPDPDQGIGTWTQKQFARAVTLGVSPAGAHYYPAFPYTSYTLMEPQDVTDLFAFMQTLPASEEPNKAHDVGFPFSLRRGVGVWKALYLPEGFTSPEPQNEAEQQGRYLAEALGHCAECHTPRNALGGLQREAWMQGAPDPSGTGKIPGITRAQLDWSAADLATYLSSGFTPEYDSAGGDMATVISGLAKLPQQDIEALAAFIVTLK